MLKTLIQFLKKVPNHIPTLVESITCSYHIISYPYHVIGITSKLLEARLTSYPKRLYSSYNDIHLPHYAKGTLFY